MWIVRAKRELLTLRLISIFLQIYVVMEKMNGDMLEMILNSPTSRLTERVTKFMIYQVCFLLFHIQQLLKSLSYLK